LARTPKIWPRKGRGYFTTLNGQQIPLGRDLRAAKIEFRRLQLAGKAVSRGEYSTAELVDLYLADCAKRVAKNKLAPSTLESYGSYLLRWARACRRLAPDLIRVHHLDAWVESHEATWSPDTQALAIRIVQGWSAWCAAKDYIDADRLAAAKSPAKIPRSPAAAADLLAMGAAITDPDFADWFWLLYDTGCRPGELRRLSAADVDWARGAATVSGKTGERLIGITERSMAILRRRRSDWKEGPLLRTLHGVPWTKGSIQYHWHKWRLNTHLIPYHCRHALWARWHAAGVSDVVIARQLGHTSAGLPHLRLLITTYSHADADVLAAAARAAAQSAKASKRG
jgi:integrase